MSPAVRVVTSGPRWKQAATREEIMLVMKGAGFLAIHSASLGAPILLEEGKAAGKARHREGCRHSLLRQAEGGRPVEPAWDPFFELDPQWTDQFFEAVFDLYTGKIFDPKFVELLSIACDASVTHMYAPGTRRHIKAALALGASMEEIMEVLKVAVSFGGEVTLNMGVPILAEELRHSRRSKRRSFWGNASSHWQIEFGTGQMNATLHHALCIAIGLVVMPRP